MSTAQGCEAFNNFTFCTVILSFDLPAGKAGICILHFFMLIIKSMTISKAKTKIAICGLGYVGFPVALLFAKAGFRVTGVDVDEEKVKKINRGGNPIEGKEPGLKELISQVMRTDNFTATSDVAEYREADVIIVAVETPVEDDTL